MERQACEVAGQYVFRLNLSRDIKERNCRICEEKMICTSRRTAWQHPHLRLRIKIWWEIIIKVVDLTENWIKCSMDLGKSNICKLSSYLYFQQKNVIKLMYQWFLDKRLMQHYKGAYLNPRTRVLIQHLQEWMRASKPDWCCVLKTESVGWWEVISPRSWDQLYLPLSLIFMVKASSLLVKRWWHTVRHCQGWGNRQGSKRKKLWAQSDIKGVMFSRMGGKLFRSLW